MSVPNRATGRSSKSGTKTEPSVTIKQTVKTETIKVVEKEKKQVPIELYFDDILDQVPKLRVFCYSQLLIKLELLP